MRDLSAIRRCETSAHMQRGEAAADAVYLVYFSPCDIPECVGKLFCNGHGLCVECAARTRKGDARFLASKRQITRCGYLPADQSGGGSGMTAPIPVHLPLPRAAIPVTVEWAMACECTTLPKPCPDRAAAVAWAVHENRPGHRAWVVFRTVTEWEKAQ